MNKRLFEKSGITLIALVITIIVLLILAGITLTLVIGENGLIAKAKRAGKNTIEAQVIENDALANYENSIDTAIGSARDDNKIQLSTDEHIIGTWITGETLYSKTIYIESLPNSTATVNYPHGITDAKMVWIDYSNSFMRWGNSNTSLVTSPFASSNSNTSAFLLSIPAVYPTTISIKTDGDRSEYNAYITLNYIKN